MGQQSVASKGLGQHAGALLGAKVMNFVVPASEIASGDQSLFIADRDYRLYQARAVWSVAATSGNVVLQELIPPIPTVGNLTTNMDIGGTANTVNAFNLTTAVPSGLHIINEGNAVRLNDATAITIGSFVELCIQLILIPETDFLYWMTR